MLHHQHQNVDDQDEDSSDSSNNFRSFLVSLLEACGRALVLKDESELEATMVTCNMMGLFYGVLKQNRDWILQNSTNLSKAQATQLVMKQYMAILEKAQCIQDDSDCLEALIDEQTPGGLNEQGLSNLEKLGVMASYDKILDSMVSRIRGQSDGSIADSDYNCSVRLRV